MGESRAGKLWAWMESEMIDTHFFYFGGCRVVQSTTNPATGRGLVSAGGACALRGAEKAEGQLLGHSHDAILEAKDNRH